VGIFIYLPFSLLTLVAPVDERVEWEKETKCLQGLSSFCVCFGWWKRSISCDYILRVKHNYIGEKRRREEMVREKDEGNGKREMEGDVVQQTSSYTSLSPLMGASGPERTRRWKRKTRAFIR